VDAARGADIVGLTGRAMLVAGAVLLVLTAVAVVLPLVRVRRRALALRAAVEQARRDTLTALALLHAQRAETEALLRPWRTLLRWARHPLVVATWQWYRRRRAAERQARRAHG
jgi:hypothetical protein